MSVSLKKDPCGYICICFTYMSLIYADYVVIKWIVLQTMQDSLWGPFNVVLFNSLILLLTLSHFRAMCSDPGVIPLPQTKMDFSDIYAASKEPLNQDDWTVCTRCETYRPPRAHHCRICQRCIRRMDHHCPWINNCVGELNQRFFIQFLMYAGVLTIYTLLLVTASWLKECPSCSQEYSIRELRVFHSIALVLESILFGIFVILVLHDQLQSLSNDETLIEEFYSENRRHIAKHKLLFWKLCKSPNITRNFIGKQLHNV
ncbi:palmitoyltransferase ZDHHC7-like [Planococcus citri]|uniref:palmitoyltransferase ZDHHC7-like n=1 Tax=Planococcus citri TaxID=170843 RepID=UPI0031F7D868